MNAINVEVIRGLQEKLKGVGEQAFIEELITTFLKFTPQRIEDFNKAVELKNFEQIKHIAHTTKAAAETVGAEELGRLCTLIDRAGGMKDLLACKALLKVMSQEYLQAKDQLQALQLKLF